MTDSVNELALRDTYRFLELEGVDISSGTDFSLCFRISLLSFFNRQTEVCVTRRMLSQGYYCGKHGCQNTRWAANLIADEEIIDRNRSMFVCDGVHFHHRDTEVTETTQRS